MTKKLLHKLRLFKHFIPSLRKRGFGRTMRIAIFELWYDHKFGAKTGYVIPAKKLDYTQDIRVHAQPYFPSSFLFLHEVFCSGRIFCRDAVLVDYGCGMGRVLLFASTLPFRQLIGVEIAPELCEIASTNMARYYQRRRKHTPEWTIINDDARNFPIPDAANVFYMYNPFDAAVIEEVISRILGSVRKVPRRCILIYANPIYESAFVSRGFTTVFSRLPDFAVYELSSAPVLLRNMELMDH